MNTTNESLQPSPAHPRTNALFIALKKIAAVTIALMGIGFILWLDSWYMNHSDMPKTQSRHELWTADPDWFPDQFSLRGHVRAADPGLYREKRHQWTQILWHAFPLRYR